MLRLLFIVFFSLSFGQYNPVERNKNVDTTIAEKLELQVSKDETRLYELIMAYRKSKNLPEIPLSKSLTHVAQIHSRDLSENWDENNKRCNMHSWSKNPAWSSCCYTSDHEKAECMWNKPRELSDYDDNGYEIAFGSFWSDGQTRAFDAKAALDGWKNSPGHNHVIINSHAWKDFKWKAVGVGVYHGFATVWFGESTDPEGGPEKP